MAFVSPSWATYFFFRCIKKKLGKKKVHPGGCCLLRRSPALLTKLMARGVTRIFLTLS